MEAKAKKKKYPVAASSYTLLEEVGQGASAVVYRAKCIPFNEVVAIKVLDLERCNSNLDDIRREVKTMSLINHPNVLSFLCSFVAEQSLWVVMPYMAGGSCLHIMKSAYPDGFEEPVIATFMKECLKGLEYLHRQGHIHRDVKAGNILVDASGTVKLGDFGVSACMFDTGDRQRARNTFVGTPCWMAPEVLEQVHGYDFKADIWSFGITALELAHGHAPFSKYPPMKVLLMTLQNAPPGLDYERDKRFSKSFKEMIAMCLVKNPAKRPPAEKLLRHSFFKHARSSDYIVHTVLDGLVSLGERFRDLKMKDADRLGQKNLLFDENEERSQTEYKRGVSGWNFDIEDLKAQASLMQDDDGCFTGKEDQEPADTCSEAQFLPSPSFSHSSSDDLHVAVTIHSLIAEVANDAGGPVTRVRSGPLCPAQFSIPGSPKKYLLFHEEGYDSLVHNACHEGSHTFGDKEREQSERNEKFILRHEEMDKSSRLNVLGRRACSGPLVPEHVVGVAGYHEENRELNRVSDMRTDDDVETRPITKERAFSGPLYPHAFPDHCIMNGVPHPPRQPKDGIDKGVIVQKKGRFSVTPADIELAEGHAPNIGTRRNASFQALPQLEHSAAMSHIEQIPATGISSILQTLLQSTITQQDLIMKLIKSVRQAGHPNDQSASEAGIYDLSDHPELVPNRDQELLQQVADLQNRLAILVDELQAAKLRNVNLERQLNAICNKETENFQKEGELNQQS